MTIERNKQVCLCKVWVGCSLWHLNLHYHIQKDTFLNTTPLRLQVNEASDKNYNSYNFQAPKEIEVI